MTIGPHRRNKFEVIRCIRAAIAGIVSLLMTMSTSAFALASSSDVLAKSANSPDTVKAYVSTKGRDSWSGGLPSPNRNMTDGPMRGLQSALRKIEILSAKNPRPNTSYEVILRQGKYLELNGTQTHFVSRRGSRLEIRNYPGEFVTITGGVELNEFRPLTGLESKAHISPEFAKNVYVFDLKKAGIENFGEISQRGDPPLQLFFDDSLMTVARYPNSGWLKIAGVPQSGKVLYNLGLERERRYDGIPVGRNFGMINYSGDRPARWDRQDKIYVHGYWTWDWFDSYKRVDHVSLRDSSLTLSPAADPYGYTEEQRYYFLNVPEELDSATEWYLDDSTGMLYFWPPRKISEGETVVSVNETPLLQLSDCSGVTVSGIYFDISRGDGVVIDGGSNNRIQGCLFRNIGGHAVEMRDGHNNGVESSIISGTGLDAVVVTGGDRRSLAPGRNFVANNEISHFGNWLQTVHGITMSGVGNVVEHNEISDAPFEGMYLAGNNHVVEYNDFHDICRSSGDAGALHTGRDWTWRGNVIKYNYFHDLKGPGLHGVMGVYLDDWATAFTVYGNVFQRAGHAVFIGGGRDNVVENNIFIGCEPSVSIDARGFGWASYYFNGVEGTELFDKMYEVKYWQKPYSTAYPKLATLARDDPANPSSDLIADNISCGGRWLEIHDYGTFDPRILNIKHNLIGDAELIKRRLPDQIGWDPYYLNLETDSTYVIMKMGDVTAEKELAGNYFSTNTDLVSITNGRLVIAGTAALPGFKPIPFDKIGIMENSRRRLAEWLCREASRTIEVERTTGVK